MNISESGYLQAMRDILENGEKRITRNSITLSKFSVKLDFDIRESFPLLTTKKVFWKGIVAELLWFIQGDTNSKHLESQKVNIWKANSTREFLDENGLYDYSEGDCGPIYGFQWRHFGAKYRGMDENYIYQGIDQLQQVIQLIRTEPTSRRIFMSAWNPIQLNHMCLPPCHVSYQFYVSNQSELSCILYQRSGDMFLGIPFNIASAALLTYMIAKITEKTPGSLTIMIGDAHIYENHIDAVKIQLSREPLPFPTLKLSNTFSNMDDYKKEHIELENYICHDAIVAEMVA